MSYPSNLVLAPEGCSCVGFYIGSILLLGSLTAGLVVGQWSGCDSSPQVAAL